MSNRGGQKAPLRPEDMAPPDFELDMGAPEDFEADEGAAPSAPAATLTPGAVSREAPEEAYSPLERLSRSALGRWMEHEEIPEGTGQVGTTYSPGEARAVQMSNEAIGGLGPTWNATLADPLGALRRLPTNVGRVPAGVAQPSGDEFERVYNEQQAALRATQEQQPGASAAGQIAGAIANPVNLATAGYAAETSIPRLARVGRAGLVGAGTGYARGYAGATGSTQERQAAAVPQALVGGAAGIGLQGVGEGLGAAGRSAASGSTQSATLARMRAGGMTPADIQNVADTYPGGVAAFVDVMRREGMTGLASTVEELAPRFRGVEQRSGQALGRVRREASGMMGSGTDSGELANRIRSEVAASLGGGAAPENRALAERMSALADNIQSMGRLSVEQMQDLKEEMASLGRFDQATPAPIRDAYRNVSRVIRDEMEGAIERVSPELAAESEQARQSYGAATRLREAADERSIRNVANRQISPSDYGAAGVGALVGAQAMGVRGAALGLATGVANRALRGREHSMAATTYEAIVRMASQNPQQLAQRVGPSAAGQLSQAAQRGEQAVAAAYYTLVNNDPQFRQAVNESENQEEQQ